MIAALTTLGCAALIFVSVRDVALGHEAEQRGRLLSAIADLRAGAVAAHASWDAAAAGRHRMPWRHTFEIDPVGRPLAAYASGFGQLAPALRQMVAQLGGRYDEESPVTDAETSVLSDLVADGDAVSLAVVELDAPAVGDHTAARATVSAAPLDLFVPALERASGVVGLAVAAQPTDYAPNGQTLTDRHGRIVGWLTWQTSRPVARGVVPLTIVLGLAGTFLLGLAVWSLRGSRRLGDELADSAQHAQAYRDTLTGLPNRLCLIEGLDQALADRRDNASVAFVHIDPKGFKEINETLGHHGGDQLLAAIGARLREELPAEALLGRLGGDEFALVVSAAEPDIGLRMSKAIEDAHARPFTVNGQQIQVAVSIGLSQAPRDGCRRDELVLRADLALRAAKKLGRGGVVVFEPAMEAELEERRFLKQELRRALDDGALHLHYQPIVAGDGTRICGVEALLRWTHPTRGPIPPNVFVPVAEQTGLMDELGEMVLRRALADASRWPNLYIAVNISPVQMREPGFIDLVAGVIDEAGIPASRVVLEVTEGVLIDDPDQAQKRLDALRALGVRVALDDFGVGYSSLSYLQRFPFDKLKIDKQFVAPLGRSANGAVIVQSIVGLGRALGLSVLAEGVETEEQRILLRLAGCNEMQGFLFAKPSPRETIDELVAKVEGRGRTARARGGASVG